jgi:hypothetical protein
MRAVKKQPRKQNAAEHTQTSSATSISHTRWLGFVIGPIYDARCSSAQTEVAHLKLPLIEDPICIRLTLSNM